MPKSTSPLKFTAIFLSGFINLYQTLLTASNKLLVHYTTPESLPPIQLRWYSDHAMGCMNCSSVPNKGKFHSPKHPDHQWDAPHPASYSVDNRGSYPRGKKVARE